MIEVSIAGAVGVAVLLFVLAYFALDLGAPKFALHAYQYDFLKNFGAAKGVPPAGALQILVDKAMGDKKVAKAMYEELHCVHCGSVKPADWIASRKGSKDGYRLRVSPEAVAFLQQEQLAKMDRVDGVKKMFPDELRSDPSKAARCTIDWAIKNYGAAGDGEPKPE